MATNDVLIPFINSFIVLNEVGERIIAKYFDGKSITGQSYFEAVLFKKSEKVASSTNNGVVFFITSEDDFNMPKEELVVFTKLSSECFVFIVSSTKESEVILAEVLEVFTVTLSSVLKGDVTGDKMSNNLHHMLLILDELLDDGNVLELDSAEILQRVLMKKDGEQIAPGSQEGLANQAFNFFRNITTAK